MTVYLVKYLSHGGASITTDVYANGEQAQLRSDYLNSLYWRVDRTYKVEPWQVK